MENQDFNCSTSAKISAKDAMQKISKVTDWWGIGFTGSAEKKDDKFVVKMGGESFFDFTVSELIPDKKVVWLITDCNMPWYEDKKEWANTKIIFNLAENSGVTTVSFTHQGLTPRVACYKDCEKGWTHWIAKSLTSYFTTGKGDFKQS